MLLSLAIWVPILAGVLVLAAGGNAGDERNAALQRKLALAGAAFGFLVTLPLYAGFNLATPSRMNCGPNSSNSSLLNQFPYLSTDRPREWQGSRSDG